MGRAPCCEKVGLKRGRWTAEEDEILRKYIDANGEGSWRSLPKNAGLLRCGKSCRLRWINYLRSDLKRGNITAEEEDIILKLHATLGNRWSLIAGQLPGRTDNEIKNYWNSHLSRKISSYGAGNPILNSQMTTTKEALVAGIATPKRRGGRTSRAAMKKNRGVVPTAAGAYNIITPLKNISSHNLLPVLNNDNDSSSNNNNNKVNYRKEDGDNNARTKKKKNNNNNVVVRSTIQTLTATKGSVVTTATTALKGDHQLAASNNYNMITSPNYEPHISSSLIMTSPNYSINNNNNNDDDEVERGGGGGHPITTNQGLTAAVDIKGHVEHHRTTTTTDHQDDMLCFDQDLMVSPAGLILTSTEGEVNKYSTKNNTSSSSVVLAGEADHESSCCEQRTLNSTTSTTTANSSTTVASYLHQQQQEDHNSTTCCWFDIGDQSGSINNNSCCFANSAVDDSLLMWDNINVNVEGGGGNDETTKDILSWLWDTSSTHHDYHMDPAAADNTTTAGSPATITNTQDFGDLESRQQALVAWLLS